MAKTKSPLSRSRFSMPNLNSLTSPSTLHNYKNDSYLFSFESFPFKKIIASGLLLLLSLSLAIPATPAIADPAVVKWSKVNIPTEGTAGNWVLADGSDVQHLTQAIDGTFYCYANPSGTSYTLYKSTDEGRSWSYTGRVTDNIVALATAPDDASIVYYATSSDVCKSTNAGSTFTSLALNPGGAGSNNIEITSIGVALMGSNRFIAVGTRDTDTSQFGGVYVLDENKPFSGWIDTNLGSYDVYAVALSPNFATDQQFIAVVTDETDTFVTTQIGGAGWGATVGDAKLDKDNSGTSVVVDTSADIGFPSDYDSDVTTGGYVQFVAIDAGSENGDVYMINGAAGSSVAIDLNIGSDYGLSNVDVTTLAIMGNAAEASLLAGAGGSAQVYHSTDGGSNWTESTKQPTGQSKTYVLMAGSRRAYAATSGTESALSITQDGGVTWNQVGLIDADIDDIVDLALSPNYSQDNSLFMLTYGGEHSLWRSLDGGTTWERVLCSTLADIDRVNLVELSPQYGSASQVVFIARTSSGNPAIWKSTDDGQTFSRARPTRDSTTGASFDIKTWTVVNNTTLFIGSYDDTNGLVYRTTNGGLSYSTSVVTGNQTLKSIVLSPSYDEDETILVGNANGWIYWSSNNGTSFEPLPLDATLPPLSGKIAVAFAPEFSSNNTIYAASDNTDVGIYRFIIGTSENWTSIDSTLPGGGMLSQLMVSADGTLYATNFKADGGMERSLNPTYQLGPTFETVTRGLSNDATLTGLWLCDNRLWSVDTTNTRLMTFTDSLAQPVIITSPSNKAPGMGAIIDYNIDNINLDWETLRGAISYTWQLDYDTDFTSVPTGFEASTKASSARLPTLDPATIYYWRVRATEPVLSRWSAKWSFATSIGTEAIAPKLSSPKAAASGVPIEPLFQWSAVAGAESYELVVSTDTSLANPVILKIGAYTLPSTAWECNVGLSYDTTYYWKVRAIGANTQSTWSAVGAFTTGSPPAPESPPKPLPAPEPSPSPPPSPPPPPAQQATPDWVIYLVGALFLTIVLLLITMLVLVVIVRRP